MNWNFKQRMDRGGRWEAYYSPQGPEMAELYRWCWHTLDRKSTRLNSSHSQQSRMPSSA